MQDMHRECEGGSSAQEVDNSRVVIVSLRKTLWNTSQISPLVPFPPSLAVTLVVNILNCDNNDEDNENVASDNMSESTLDMTKHCTTLKSK